MLGVVCCANVRAQTPRPVILIFAVSDDRIPAVTEKKATPDGLADGDRILLAAKAVRQQFDEPQVVETLLFRTDEIYFQRAAEAASVKLTPGTDPTEEERVRIGEVVRANYVVSVFSHVAPELGASPTIELAGIEVKPGGKLGKRWGPEKISVGMSQGTTPIGVRKEIPDSLMTAARTLVLHFFAGPLREFRLNAPVPELLPQKRASVPSVTVAEEIDPDAEALVLIRRAEEQLQRERTLSAIQTLREAVNLAPRSVLPRLKLAEAYLVLGKPADAASEARRAQAVASNITPEQRSALGRVVSRALQEDGDVNAARSGFEQLIKDDPKNLDARLGLAELLLQEGQTDRAEIQYRAARRLEPGNRDAAIGLARILTAKNDFEGALQEGKLGTAEARHVFATAVFIESANALAARASQNRAAWEEGKLSRELFYRATLGQSERMNKIADLIASAPPPETAGEVLKRAHNRRVFAAQLLAQAIASLTLFLEAGDTAAGLQAKNLLQSYYNEMKDAERVNAKPVAPKLPQDNAKSR